MEKICLFGGTGKTGQHVAKELLSRGYEISILTRSGRKLDSKEGGVNQTNFVIGDILNKNDVFAAMLDCDAVISVVGHTKKSDPRMQTRGIKNIIDAMGFYKIKRLVSLTGTGVRQPEDEISLIDRIANYLIHKIDPARIEDGIEHAKIIAESDVSWTILRVLKLSNSKTKVGKYKLCLGCRSELFSSRIKVAKILVDLTEANEFNRKMPVISK